MSDMTPPSVPDPQDDNNAATPPPPPPPPPGAYGSGAATPPPAAGGTRPAELLDRFLAKLIDGILMAIVGGMLITFLIIGTIFSNGGGWLGSSLAAILSAVIYVGYFAFMESNSGQTVGKMVMKLRVLGPDGGNPTLEQAVKRNIYFGFGVLGVIPFIGGFVGWVGQIVAVVMIAVGINGDTVSRKAWHDEFAGGTRVVKEG